MGPTQSSSPSRWKPWMDEFGRLLEEIENMSEHEAQITLDRNPDNQHVD